MKKTVFVSIFVIALLVLSGCASNTVVPPVSTRTETQPDLTSDWKSYKSNTYGFTFEYPADKFNITGDNPIKLENTILPPSDGSQASMQNGYLNYEISITTVDANTSVADWVKQNWPNQDKATQSDINLDGVAAIRFQNSELAAKTNMYIFLIKDNKLIQISGHYANPEKSKYYEQIKSTWLDMGEKFLTSFKFIK